jgi:hypothetical protein
MASKTTICMSFHMKTMEKHIEERLLAWPFLASSALSLCGLISLLLAVVGLYGVIAYSMSVQHESE